MEHFGTWAGMAWHAGTGSFETGMPAVLPSLLSPLHAVNSLCHPSLISCMPTWDMTAWLDNDPHVCIWHVPWTCP